jgi:hypothetical protein
LAGKFKRAKSVKKTIRYFRFSQIIRGKDGRGPKGSSRDLEGLR